MRKKLLKQTMMALLLMVAVPFVNAQVHVGDILCEGNLIYPPSTYPSSGATAIGVVFYVDQTGQHGWAVALQDAGNYAWGPIYDDTPLPNFGSVRQAIYDLDGYQNTQVIRATGTNYPAFYAVDFENGWYLPAIGQLNCLYGNIQEVNPGLAMAGGVVFAYSEWRYWSSTEHFDHYAWNLLSSGTVTVNLGYNDSTSGHKTTSWRVRGVRNF